IEEYLPIIAPDGTVEAIFEIYRDGEPLLAAISQAQTSALSIVLLAAMVLAGLLSLLAMLQLSGNFRIYDPTSDRPGHSSLFE
ncbi:MAG: hypothetical protein ONB49_09680, partial [candidate division KSB1 bacterium]|nr:hypothetical protein [candidate division KSB1 bacterium]